MTDIKTRFTEELFLILLDSEKPYILKTDVLNYAIKSILKQKINKKLYSVAFYSRKFTNVKFNYKIYDKKLLTIIAIFKKLKIYFKKLKYSVTIYNDHKNLT